MKFNRTGVWVKDLVEGKFSEANWGTETDDSGWVADLYPSIEDLTDAEWTSIMTGALQTFKTHYKRDPEQEKTVRMAAQKEADAINAALATPTAGAAPCRVLQNKATPAK